MAAVEPELTAFAPSVAETDAAEAIPLRYGRARPQAPRTRPAPATAAPSPAPARHDPDAEALEIATRVGERLDVAYSLLRLVADTARGRAARHAEHLRVFGDVAVVSQIAQAERERLGDRAKEQYARARKVAFAAAQAALHAAANAAARQAPGSTADTPREPRR